jgi:peroxiredoxin
MMKRLFLIMIILIAAIFYRKSTITAQNYEVTGKISGAEGITFTLQKNASGKVVYIGKAIVKNGMFKMTGDPVNYPEYVSLVTLNKKKGVSFFLENSPMTISGRLDSLGMVKINGSKTQDEYMKLNSDLKPFIKKSNLLGKEYQVASKAGDAAKMSALIKQNDILRKEMRSVQESFIINNPGSFAAPLVLTNLINTKLLRAAELDSLANLMSPEVSKTTTMVELKQKITALKKTDLGQKAPDFKMMNEKGVQVSLSSMIGPKLLLIDFWAAWCGPCRQENPNVVKTYNDFHSKGFDILGVSLDRKKDDWIKAIADDKLTWTHVSDLQYFSNEAAVLYSVNSIPANFLLDKNGIIIAKNLRGENLYNKIKELLGSE